MFLFMYSDFTHMKNSIEAPFIYYQSKLGISAICVYNSLKLFGILATNSVSCFGLMELLTSVTITSNSSCDRLFSSGRSGLSCAIKSFIRFQKFSIGLRFRERACQDMGKIFFRSSSANFLVDE